MEMDKNLEKTNEKITKEAPHDIEKKDSRDQNVIYIQMLGGFSMTYQGQPVVLGKSLSSKALHLLMLLIYSRGEGIHRSRLLEQLYGDSDTEQAANSLRAMIFRLRKSLIAAGLPKGEYISTKGGVYTWTADHVDVELDVEVFQKQVMAALEEKDPMKKVDLLKEACALYKGEFLPLMIADDWVSAANWKYQELYFKVLRELGRLLKKQNRHEELLPYCEQALSRYPYEEWQLVKLECLTAMKEYKTAVEYYEQIAKETQQEYGIRMSDEMLEHYRSIRNMIQYEMNNLEDIQEHLKPDPNVFGATRCDYLTFIDIYRYIVWVLGRERTRAHLVLFTLIDREGEPLESSEQLEEVRSRLERSIIRSVRRSDLYTRYGKNQFLVLVTSTDEKGCHVAAERVCQNFHSANRRRKIDVYYTCRPALAVNGDSLKKNVGKGVKELELMPEEEKSLIENVETLSEEPETMLEEAENQFEDVE